MVNYNAGLALKAIKKGDAELLQEAFDNHVPANSTTKRGKPLLIAAIEEADAEMVEVILKARADVNSVDSNNLYTPLIAAVVESQTDVVTRLLETKIDSLNVNLVDKDGNTALHHALAQSNAEAALALMQSKHKADPSIGTSDGTFPIHTASANGLCEVVKYMTKRGNYSSQMDGKGELALGHAVQGDDVETMQTLLKHGCDVTHTNANGETVLHHAASYAASKCLAELASNVDVAKLVNAVNKDGHSALDLAVAATGTDKACAILKEMGGAAVKPIVLEVQGEGKQQGEASNSNDAVQDKIRQKRQTAGKGGKKDKVDKAQLAAKAIMGIFALFVLVPLGVWVFSLTQ